MLNILGRQNTTIAQLNADADAIFAQLADRREDVVHFIDNAGRTAAISAERSEDLSRNFDLLDDFLAELQPTMVELEKLAATRPRCSPTSAPPLPASTSWPPTCRRSTAARATRCFPRSRRRRRQGRPRQEQGGDRGAQPDQHQGLPAADEVAKFLESIDDPSNATEEDCDARRDLRDQPGEADRRVALLEQKLGTT